MKKILLVSLLVVMQFVLLVPSKAWESKDSEITFNVEFKKVNRKEALEKFFDKYDSPLKANVDTFIKVADSYEIDYRLIPSISCMESTCGRFLIQDLITHLDGEFMVIMLFISITTMKLSLL